MCAARRGDGERGAGRGRCAEGAVAAALAGWPQRQLDDLGCPGRSSGTEYLPQQSGGDSPADGCRVEGTLTSNPSPARRGEPDGGCGERASIENVALRAITDTGGFS